MLEAATPRAIELTTDLARLISASAGGDETSLEMLRGLLLPGIRILLTHRDVDLSSADRILAQVLRDVREGQIRSRSELLYRTRRAVIEASISGASPVSHTRPATSERSWPAQARRDREMMRLYYVDGESPLTICRRMEISLEVFNTAKTKFRRWLEGGREQVNGERCQ